MPCTGKYIALRPSVAERGMSDFPVIAVSFCGIPTRILRLTCSSKVHVAHDGLLIYSGRLHYPTGPQRKHLSGVIRVPDSLSQVHWSFICLTHS